MGRRGPRITSKSGVIWVRDMSLKEERRPFGAVEHLGGALAFAGMLAFGMRLVEAVASAVYGLGGRGGFMRLGTPSWPDIGGPSVVPMLMALAMVALTIAVFDQWSLNSRHRTWIPPLMVWVGLAALAWATGDRGGRHEVTLPAALGIGVSAAMLFSAWWLVAIAIARVRRSRLGRNE
jgi:hypothetical protein